MIAKSGYRRPESVFRIGIRSSVFARAVSLFLIPAMLQQQVLSAQSSVISTPTAHCSLTTDHFLFTSQALAPQELVGRQTLLDKFPRLNWIHDAALFLKIAVLTGGAPGLFTAEAPAGPDSKNPSPEAELPPPDVIVKMKAPKAVEALRVLARRIRYIPAHAHPDEIKMFNLLLGDPSLKAWKLQEAFGFKSWNRNRWENLIHQCATAWYDIDLVLHPRTHFQSEAFDWIRRVAVEILQADPKKEWVERTIKKAVVNRLPDQNDARSGMVDIYLRSILVAEASQPQPTVDIIPGRIIRYRAHPVDGTTSALSVPMSKSVSMQPLPRTLAGVMNQRWASTKTSGTAEPGPILPQSDEIRKLFPLHVPAYLLQPLIGESIEDVEQSLALAWLRNQLPVNWFRFKSLFNPEGYLANGYWLQLNGRKVHYGYHLQESDIDGAEIVYLPASEATTDLPYDSRPAKAGLLDSAYIRHAQAYKEVLNPDNRDDFYALSAAAGAGLSDFLLTSNSPESLWVDTSYDFLNAPSLNVFLAEYRRDPAPYAEAMESYKSWKHDMGFAFDYAMRSQDRLLLALVCELQSIDPTGEALRSAVAEDVYDAIDRCTYVRLRFQWAYTGQPAREYKITFVDADIRHPRAYPHILNEFLDRGIRLYYQRAATNVASAYADFIPAIAAHLRGWFLTDDYATVDDADRVQNLGPTFPLPSPEVHIPATQRWSHKIVAQRRNFFHDQTTLSSDDPRLHYGWDQTLRAWPPADSNRGEQGFVTGLSSLFIVVAVLIYLAPLFVGGILIGWYIAGWIKNFTARKERRKTAQLLLQAEIRQAMADTQAALSATKPELDLAFQKLSSLPREYAMVFEPAVNDTQRSMKRIEALLKLVDVRTRPGTHAGPIDHLAILDRLRAVQQYLLDIQSTFRILVTLSDPSLTDSILVSENINQAMHAVESLNKITDSAEWIKALFADPPSPNWFLRWLNSPIDMMECIPLAVLAGVLSSLNAVLTDQLPNAWWANSVGFAASIVPLGLLLLRLRGGVLANRRKENASPGETAVIGAPVAFPPEGSASAQRVDWRLLPQTLRLQRSGKSVQHVGEQTLYNAGLRLISLDSAIERAAKAGDFSQIRSPLEELKRWTKEYVDAGYAAPPFTLSHLEKRDTLRRILRDHAEWRRAYRENLEYVFAQPLEALMRRWTWFIREPPRATQRRHQGGFVTGPFLLFISAALSIGGAPIPPSILHVVLAATALFLALNAGAQSPAALKRKLKRWAQQYLPPSDLNPLPPGTLPDGVDVQAELWDVDREPHLRAIRNGVLIDDIVSAKTLSGKLTDAMLMVERGCVHCPAIVIRGIRDGEEVLITLHVRASPEVYQEIRSWFAAHRVGLSHIEMFIFKPMHVSWPRPAEPGQVYGFHNLIYDMQSDSSIAVRILPLHAVNKQEASESKDGAFSTSLIATRQGVSLATISRGPYFKDVRYRQYLWQDYFDGATPGPEDKSFQLGGHRPRTPSGEFDPRQFKLYPLTATPELMEWLRIPDDHPFVDTLGQAYTFSDQLALLESGLTAAPEPADPDSPLQLTTPAARDSFLAFLKTFRKWLPPHERSVQDALIQARSSRDFSAVYQEMTHVLKQELYVRFIIAEEIKERLRQRMPDLEPSLLARLHPTDPIRTYDADVVNAAFQTALRNWMAARIKMFEIPGIDLVNDLEQELAQNDSPFRDDLVAATRLEIARGKSIPGLDMNVFNTPTEPTPPRKDRGFVTGPSLLFISAALWIGGYGGFIADVSYLAFIGCILYAIGHMTAGHRGGMAVFSLGSVAYFLKTAWTAFRDGLAYLAVSDGIVALLMIFGFLYFFIPLYQEAARVDGGYPRSLSQFLLGFFVRFPLRSDPELTRAMAQYIVAHPSVESTAFWRQRAFDDAALPEEMRVPLAAGFTWIEGAANVTRRLKNLPPNEAMLASLWKKWGGRDLAPRTPEEALLDYLMLNLLETGLPDLMKNDYATWRQSLRQSPWPIRRFRLVRMLAKDEAFFNAVQAKGREIYRLKNTTWWMISLLVQDPAAFPSDTHPGQRGFVTGLSSLFITAALLIGGALGAWAQQALNTTSKIKTLIPPEVARVTIASVGEDIPIQFAVRRPGIDWNSVHPPDLGDPVQRQVAAKTQAIIDKEKAPLPYPLVILYARFTDGFEFSSVSVLNEVYLVQAPPLKYRRGLALIWNENRIASLNSADSSLERYTRHEVEHARRVWAVHDAFSVVADKIIRKVYPELDDPRGRQNLFTGQPDLLEFIQYYANAALLAQDEMDAIGTDPGWRLHRDSNAEFALNRDRFADAVSAIQHRLEKKIDKKERKTFHKWLEQLLSAPLPAEPKQGERGFVTELSSLFITAALLIGGALAAYALSSAGIAGLFVGGHPMLPWLVLTWMASAVFSTIWLDDPGEDPLARLIPKALQSVRHGEALRFEEESALLEWPQANDLIFRPDSQEIVEALIEFLPHVTRTEVAAAILQKFRHVSRSLDADTLARLAEAGLHGFRVTRDSVNQWILGDFLADVKIENPRPFLWTEDQFVTALREAPVDLQVAVYARLATVQPWGPVTRKLKKVINRIFDKKYFGPQNPRHNTTMGPYRVPVIALAFYLKKELRKGLDPLEMKNELEWVGGTALPALSPLMPGWEAALPGPYEWLWLAAIFLDRTLNERGQPGDYVRNAIRAGRYSKHVRNLLLLSFGPHLRKNFSYETDKSDLRIILALLSSYQEDLSWTSIVDPDNPELLERDVSLRSAVNFEQVSEVDQLINSENREILRDVLADVTRRRGEHWLHAGDHVYLNIYGELDASRLAQENAAREMSDLGPTISIGQAYNSEDPQGAPFRQIMETKKPNELVPAVQWLMKLLQPVEKPDLLLLLIAGALALTSWSMTGAPPHQALLNRAA